MRASRRSGCATAMWSKSRSKRSASLRNPVRDEVRQAAEALVRAPRPPRRRAGNRARGRWRQQALRRDPLALDRVELSVREGQIHAFLGANGAGKSTLIRILADVHDADGGRFLWRGVEMSGTEIARRIAIVHQDLGLVDFMSVGENMAMGYGYPRRRNGLIDWKAVDARARAVLDELGAPLPLHTAVSALSPAERSIVAIARAVSRDVELLILDEPTASLPEADVGRLFAALRRLKERNVAIIYVTHRLDEVFRIADAATVIRDGRTIARHASLEDVTSDQLVSEIVGRLLQHTSKRESVERPPVLEVEGLKSYAIGPVSFSLGKGEILGLAGLRSQGHEGVGRMLAGVHRPIAGSITLDGRQHRFDGTIDAIRAGIGFATGRRAEEAVAPAMTVRENLFLNPLNFGARRHTACATCAARPRMQPPCWPASR